MSSLSDVNNVQITSASDLSISGNSPTFTGSSPVTVSVSVNGGAYQTAFENIQSNAVPAAVDGYLGSFLEGGAAASGVTCAPCRAA